jgi:hypothetical protein
MENGWLFLSLLAIAFISIYALIFSYRVGFKQTSNKDEEVSKAVAKHKVLLNPIFLSYVLFVVVLTIGGIIFYYLVFGG